MACTYRQDYTWNATLCWNFQEGVRSQSTVIGTRGFMTFKQDNTSYFGWSMTNSAWDACSAGSDVEHCSFTYSEAACPRNHTALSIDMRQGTTTHYCCPTAGPLNTVLKAMDYPYKEISDDETTWRTEGDKYLSNLLCEYLWVASASDPPLTNNDGLESLDTDAPLQTVMYNMKFEIPAVVATQGPITSTTASPGSTSTLPSATPSSDAIEGTGSLAPSDSATRSTSLPVGVRVGIGIGASIGGLLLAALAVILIRTRRMRQRRGKNADSGTFVVPWKSELHNQSMPGLGHPRELNGQHDIQEMAHTNRPVELGGHAQVVELPGHTSQGKETS